MIYQLLETIAGTPKRYESTKYSRFKKGEKGGMFIRKTYISQTIDPKINAFYIGV